MKLKKTFSITDIVVLLACLAFLLACLGPVGSGGRKRAKEAMCSLNLNQWGKIITAFVGDNNGYYMDRYENNDWPEELAGYYNDERILLCPEATVRWRDGAIPPFAAWHDDGFIGSYGISLWIADDDRPEFWRTPNVSNANLIPIFGDCLWTNGEPTHNDDAPANPSSPFEIFEAGNGSNEMKRFCIDRHNGGVNLLFADNSVRKVGLKELWELEWQRDWNPDNLPPGPYPDWPEWMANFKEYYQP